MPIGVEEQLTMAQLLEDPLYAKWLSMIPKVTWVTYGNRPWRVWVQRERNGKWARRDFKSYKKAYVFLIDHLEKWHDAALHSKVVPMQPPVVRDKTTKKKRYHIPAFPGQNEHHQWCPHCRRPTIFASFSQHHAFNRTLKPAPNVRRCCICGMSANGIKAYR